MKSSNGNETIRTVPLLTYTDAREVDRGTLREDPRGEAFAEDSEILLMGLAASSALHAMKADGLLNPGTDEEARPLIFLCGSGNNGGDGLALACLLCTDPEQPLGENPQKAMMVYAKVPMRSKASRYYEERLRRCGVEIHPLEAFLTHSFPAGRRHILIEGLLGTGQSGVPSGIYREVLAEIRHCRGREGVLVSLDVPAGLTEEDPPEFDRNTDSDELLCPDYVYTFGREKAALRLHPDLTAARIRALPCGFDLRVEEEVQQRQSPALRRVQMPADPSWLSLPGSQFGRHAADHKYSAGHAWIVGGSGGMEGAALMTLRAFFASGGGYARLFHPDATSRELYLRVFPPGLYHGMDDLSSMGMGRPPRAVVIGPGLSSHDLRRATGQILFALHNLAEAAGGEDRPADVRLPLVVLDAAACSLAFQENFPDILRRRTVITPHAGEWNELGGPPPRGLAGIKTALDYLASKAGVAALLKGPISLLLRDKKIDVFDWIRPELAAAGSGDLLAGLLARALAATAPACNTEDPFQPIEIAAHQSMALLHTIAVGRSSAADFLLALEQWNLPGKTGQPTNLKDR